MKITYLDHSGFLVELERHYLLFDYIKGALPPWKADKELLVFASHRHGDHFSQEIFRAAGESGLAAAFILSDDISRRQVPDRWQDGVIWMSPRTEQKVGDVFVRTWKSTDEGVAFLVFAEGKWIYHAGDLNHWYWKGEPEEWNRQMTADYRAELERIAAWQAGRTSGERAEIDVAFVPVDARLQEYFYLGLDDFMRTVGAKAVFPMHFWGEYPVCARVKELPCAKDYRERIFEIQKEGETFLV